MTSFRKSDWKSLEKQVGGWSQMSDWSPIFPQEYYQNFGQGLQISSIEACWASLSSLTTSFRSSGVENSSSGNPNFCHALHQFFLSNAQSYTWAELIRLCAKLHLSSLFILVGIKLGFWSFWGISVSSRPGAHTHQTKSGCFQSRHMKMAGFRQQNSPARHFTHRSTL